MVTFEQACQICVDLKCLFLILYQLVMNLYTVQNQGHQLSFALIVLIHVKIYSTFLQ